jgi:hypothetical protein
MGHALAVLDELVAAVPVYELGVVPDRSVLELVRGLG